MSKDLLCGNVLVKGTSIAQPTTPPLRLLALTAKRAKLFEIYNKQSEDAEKDVGQKFLALDWG